MFNFINCVILLEEIKLGLKHTWRKLDQWHLLIPIFSPSSNVCNCILGIIISAKAVQCLYGTAVTCCMHQVLQISMSQFPWKWNLAMELVLIYTRAASCLCAWSKQCVCFNASHLLEEKTGRNGCEHLHCWYSKLALALPSSKEEQPNILDIAVLFITEQCIAGSTTKDVSPSTLLVVCIH